MNKIFCLYLSILPVLGLQLPEYMLGDFKLTTSEGFTNYMSELGVGWLKKSIACTLYPLQKIREAEGVITLDTVTTFQSTHISFKIGKEFTEETADGRTVKTVASVDGNKLIKIQIPADPTLGQKTTVEVREYVDGGKKMNMHLTVEGVPNIKSLRVYQRQ